MHDVITYPKRALPLHKHKQRSQPEWRFIFRGFGTATTAKRSERVEGNLAKVLHGIETGLREISVSLNMKRASQDKGRVNKYICGRLNQKEHEYRQFLRVFHVKIGM